jgi:hypothetical protein
MLTKGRGHEKGLWLRPFEKSRFVPALADQHQVIDGDEPVVSACSSD